MCVWVGGLSVEYRLYRSSHKMELFQIDLISGGGRHMSEMEYMLTCSHHRLLMINCIDFSNNVFGFAGRCIPICNPIDSNLQWHFGIKRQTA